jgi:AmmeMemoRadiSam system protein B
MDGDTFRYALYNAADYGAVDAVAGVVPHHLTAATMTAGFFRGVSGNDYDTVILVGPNHNGSGGEVIVSYRDWDAGGGETVECDTDMLKKISGIPLRSAHLAENDEIVEGDHAISVLVPFIHEFFPEARVAPMLVSRSLTYADTLRLAEGIESAAGKKSLLLCSIDFSHYLTAADAALRDEETLRAIKKNDCPAIHGFTNANTDSQASLIIFLKFLQARNLEPHVLAHGNSDDFIPGTVRETTSYFILAGSPATDI